MQGSCQSKKLSKFMAIAYDDGDDDDDNDDDHALLEALLKAIASVHSSDVILCC